MDTISENIIGFQNGVDSPFEDDSNLGQTPVSEQIDRLPVPAAGQEAETMELPFPQVRDVEKSKGGKRELGETAAGCSEIMEETSESDIKPVEDVAEKKAQTGAEEEKRRTEHEAAEVKRKAEWKAVQNAKKAKEQEKLERLAAMRDDEVMEASVRRISVDTEKLTRRNMKECVSEHIQTLCFSDPDFARLTMQPCKTMIHCFGYINRKAMEFLQQEINDNGIKPEGPNGAYGSDIPDDLCYQWAEAYFRDPSAQEDRVEEEQFVPRLYIGGTVTTSKARSKKATEKKEPEKKPETEKKKEVPDGQMSLLDLEMPVSNTN